jgi:hypothetical protein
MLVDQYRAQSSTALISSSKRGGCQHHQTTLGSRRRLLKIRSPFYSLSILDLHLLTTLRIPTLFIKLNILLTAIQNQFPDSKLLRCSIKSIDKNQS